MIQGNMMKEMLERRIMKLINKLVLGKKECRKENEFFLRLKLLR